MPTPYSGSTISTFSPTGNADLDALLSGTRWGSAAQTNGLTLTYSFPTDDSTWSFDEYADSEEPWNGFLALTSAQQTQVRNIFTMISTYTNLKFSEITETDTSVGDIRLGFTDMPPDTDGTTTQAYAFMPNKGYPAASGDVWLNSSTYDGFSSAAGSDDNHTLIHEIGHALGLKHPFKAYGSFNAINPDHESYDYTVMSYSAVAGEEYSTVSYAPTTLMALDVYALQYLYGKNTTYNASNTTYTFYATKNYNQTLWDTGGTDTIVYESTSTGCTIDLAPESWQSVGKPLSYQDSDGNDLGQLSETVQILRGVTIENATGGQGADRLSGNTVANTLQGRGGNDKLYGLSGNDTLVGSTGNDTLDGGTGADAMGGGDGSDIYYVSNSLDVVSETNADATTGGTDLVYTTLSTYTLGANVENGRINTSAAANLTGNSLGNVLYAGAGSNVLDGGTGTDTVSYYYASAGVTVSLASTAAQATGGSGSDTLRNVEKLSGSSYADKLTGSSGNNSLSGGAGNDVLTGGLGADRLTGGTGADRFDFNLLTELGLTSTTWDTIVDFKASEADKIDLLGVDANSALAGDQAFSFLGSLSAFAGDSTAKLRFDAVNHILYGSTDADTSAEFAIALTGVSSLSATSFVL